MKVRFAVAPQPGIEAAQLAGFATTIEDAGFDGIWLSDLPLAPVVDPLLGLALVAGRTTRLRLGANVVPLGRSPVLLAKELAQLDQLSGGRLLLSFVTGLGQPGERAALGLGDANRGDVLEEVLAAARAWWSGEPVDGIAPAARPVQDPLEVWLGGRGPKALERVGRIADGWLGAAVTADEAGAARERIHAAATAAGRVFDPEHFGLSIPYAREAPAAAMLERLRVQRKELDPLELVPVGPSALRELIGALGAAGLSKFVVRPVGRVTSWDDEAAWLADAILDLQT